MVRRQRKIALTDHDDCELTLIQGKTVTCTHDVAKIASLHLEYLSTDNWLVSVTECPNITARLRRHQTTWFVSLNGGIYPWTAS